MFQKYNPPYKKYLRVERGETVEYPCLLTFHRGKLRFIYYVNVTLSWRNMRI